MYKRISYWTITFIVAILLLWGCKNEEDITRFVNPMIGTGEFGHCFPGACIPFGMIQAGPQTGNCDWKYCAGYQYKDSVISGFSQNRLNGTGVGDLGDLLIQPFSGTSERSNFDSRFDKESEHASPGYYAVNLSDSDITTEITASEHVSFYRFTFPGNDAGLMIDFQSGIVGNERRLDNKVLNAEVTFENETTISGYCKTRAWLTRTYYYVIKFSEPFSAKTMLPLKDQARKAPQYALSFNLKKGAKLMVKIAMSSSGVDGAKENLMTEVEDWKFERTKKAAQKSWNDLLSRVDVAGDADRKAMFYTSLYHLFIQPNNIADCGSDPFYSTLSLWDTYRAAHPLYTIVSPERVDGFINSMVKQHEQQGFLPIWALWGGETYCMIANHAIPVIADAYIKGFRGFDAEKAFNAVKNSLIVPHRNSEWNTYMKYGYFPFDSTRVESVSKTLESVYDDYCAAQFAKVLGKKEDQLYFEERAEFYKNLYDSSVGLMRGKDSKGNWRTPFDPFDLSHAGSSGGDYTEGNAWQYTWHVQHDVNGLIELMGGNDKFTERLDSLFSFSDVVRGKGLVVDVTGLIGQYAHGNEPSHHVAYLYALAGNPWRTQELINEICRTQYINKFDGLCGNDDCGQMSAWYIFSSMGFYPVNPCGGEFVLGAPQIPGVKLKLPGDKTFTMEAENFSDNNIYVQSVELNGSPYSKTSVSYNDIMEGGKLRFIMGSGRR
jgi:predicted alpha-1,2-mannosidase